jgi:hypothetical protein
VSTGIACFDIEPTDNIHPTASEWNVQLRFQCSAPPTTTEGATVNLIPTSRYETFRMGGRRIKFIVAVFQAKLLWKRWISNLKVSRMVGGPPAVREEFYPPCST